MKSVHAERIPQTVGSPRSAADSMLPRATFWRCGFDHIWSPNRAASHSLAGQLLPAAGESEVNYHGGGRIRTNVAVVAVCVWLLRGAGLSHVTNFRAAPVTTFGQVTSHGQFPAPSCAAVRLRRVGIYGPNGDSAPVAPGVPFCQPRHDAAVICLTPNRSDPQSKKFELTRKERKNEVIQSSRNGVLYGADSSETRTRFKSSQIGRHS